MFNLDDSLFIRGAKEEYSAGINHYNLYFYEYKNGTKLYAIPHLNRRYNYQKLKENLGITSVYPE